jgi:hypothetical protein
VTAAGKSSQFRLDTTPHIGYNPPVTPKTYRISFDLIVTPEGESNYFDNPAEWIPDALLLNLEDGETYTNFTCEEIK